MLKGTITSQYSLFTSRAACLVAALRDKLGAVHVFISRFRHIILSDPWQFCRGRAGGSG